jgi:Mg2+/Co2+ transporter CorB
MFLGMIDIKKTTINEIMIHKNEIISINIDNSPIEALNKAMISDHLSIPVWKDNKENIIGILNVKKLLLELSGQKTNISKIDLKDYMSKPYFIPETITVFDQLIDFKKNKSNLAIIIDEYSELQGLITFKDIIEEIVGEVQDSDKNRTNFITKKSPKEYVIDGRSLVRDVNRKLGTHFKIDNANTLAGLIINKFEKIPKISEEITIDNVRFTVLKLSKNTVKLIKAELQS